MSPKVDRREFLRGVALLPLASLSYKGLWSAVDPQIAQTRHRSSKSPNVLVVVFDTLSALHMSLYGYRRHTTPNLERFAEQAFVYHNHYASGNFTTPGTAALLTGSYPWSNRAFNFKGTVDKHYVERNLFNVFAGTTYHRIAYTHNRLVGRLLYQFRDEIDQYIKRHRFCLFDSELNDRMFQNDADIAIRSFDDFVLQKYSSGSLFLGIAERVRGFLSERDVLRDYADAFPYGVPEINEGRLLFLLEDAINGIIDVVRQASTPFLAYFHLLPPHEPYKPRREFVNMFDDEWQPAEKEEHFFSEDTSNAELIQLRRAYDQYLAYADAEFGTLLDFLNRSGRLDDTIVVFTSDHGQLFERGIHGHLTFTLYEPLIRVPLLISLPGHRERIDIYEPTSCVDLLPSLLHLTGHGIPEWCEGEVLPGIGEQRHDSERAIYAVEAKAGYKYSALEPATVALRKGRHKLIHYVGYPEYENHYELYDLHEDPEERVDLYRTGGGPTTVLQEELEVKLRQVNEPYV